MILEKKYLTFSELQSRWKCGKNDIHYLIAEMSLIPSIAWNDVLINCTWEQDAQNKDSRVLIEKKDEFGNKVITHSNGFIYLLRPEIFGPYRYSFRFASDKIYDHNETWYRLANTYDFGVLGKSVDESFVEQSAVFMMETVRLCESFELDIDSPSAKPKELEQVRGNQPTTNSYTTPWLRVVDAAITEFFNPRRPTDAKKDEIVEWVKQRAVSEGLTDSDRIAEAIFTIIKPSDHNPRKRRVNL